MDIVDEIIRAIAPLKERLARLERVEMPRWTYVTPKLTSTSWDGVAKSTAAATRIDLSSVFGVPAGVRAVLLGVLVNDSGTAGRITFGPSVATVDYCQARCFGGDVTNAVQLVVACDASGDVYYATTASGTGTLDVTIAVLGYLK